MRRVRKKAAVHQRSTEVGGLSAAATVDDRSVAVSLMQAFIPLRLKAVEEALQQGVVAPSSAPARQTRTFLSTTLS